MFVCCLQYHVLSPSLCTLVANVGFQFSAYTADESQGGLTIWINSETSSVQQNVSGVVGVTTVDGSAIGMQ